MPPPMTMRGLTTFISEIRECATKDAEQKRVEKELAHIRANFREEGKLNGYDKKKYTAKLVYMYMLGYDIDFGHMVAINLLSSPKYSEKQIGYFAVTVLLNENHEMIPLIVNSIRQDLLGKNEAPVAVSKPQDAARLAAMAEISQCLALAAVANIGGKELAEALSNHIQKLLVSSTSRDSVKKKSALCLLKLFRRFPDMLPSDQWAERLTTLLNESNFGVLLSVMSLMLALVEHNSDKYDMAIPKVVQRLGQIVLSKQCEPDYVYHENACPWLQVKFLSFLQHFPPPTQPETRKKLSEILQRIITQTDLHVRDNNFNNARYSVLFEAIRLIVAHDADPDNMSQAVSLLGKFLGAKDTNIRYLGLEGMSYYAQLPEARDNLKKHMKTVMGQLADPDISIRRRALDLLYHMCDKTNSKTIVTELIRALEDADLAIRDELVLKIAILAEKYSPDFRYYIDVILQLITISGDNVSDDIWHRVVQVVIANEDLQQYAAQQVWQAISSPKAHEMAIRVGAYILGEFGDLISREEESSPVAQFHLLRLKFTTTPSTITKGILLTTFAKMHNAFPACRSDIEKLLKPYTSHINTEVQQRAVEYLSLSSKTIAPKILELMPPFPERSSSVIQKLKDVKQAELAAAPIVSPSPAPAPAAATASLVDVGAPAPAPAPPKKVETEADFFEALMGGIGSKPAAGGSGLSDFDLLASLDPAFRPAQPVAAPAPAPASSPAPAPAPSLQFQPAPQPVQMPLPVAAPVAVAPLPLAEPFFQRMTLVNDGVVFEDAAVQIGCKSEFRGATGRFTLFFGNKNPAAPLLNFSATLVPGFEGLKIQQQPAPTVIGPHQQVQQQYGVECGDLFSAAPMITLALNAAGTQKQITVKLPVVVTKFVTPLPLQGAEFLKRWKAIPDGAPLEWQQAITTTKPLDATSLSAIFVNGFHMALLQNVDPSPANLVLSGQYNATKGQIPVMARLEPNPAASQLRITVKTPAAVLTSALRDLCLIHFS
eukprot:TRINITY_DN808_c0_g1_i1.p1 TRINITY_DN808_c0_g1~~TRINITY_DN808_c0_g1_i1.p1  ORF type:complete len:998 (-),score=275.97 TRINITY_DN808_c0_g1_i1:42-3035(-)